MICPYCDFADNIEGADVCAECGQPLDDLHLQPPSNEVERALIRDRVQVLAPHDPIVVPPDMPVGEVLRLLVDKKIGCVFVVTDEKVVGVFSERDALMRLNADAAKHLTQPVSDFMTANPQGLSADAKVAFAVRMMDQGGYRHVLLVDDHGKPTGVTSVRDILSYLSERITQAG